MRCFLILLAACALDRDIEQHVTIDEGVYGLLVDGGQPADNQRVTVFAAATTGMFASAVSGGDGVYQIELPAGDYTLCTSACTAITVPVRSRVRYDWTAGPGGGQWTALH